WSSAGGPAWSPSPARWPPASGSAPSAPPRSSGPTWSWAARTPSSSATTSTWRWPHPAPRRRRTHTTASVWPPPGPAWAASPNAGRVCPAAERFYVLEPVFDEFVDRLVDVTKGLRLGDPLDPATDVGPMVGEAQRDRV